MPTKTCKICNLTLDVSNFYINNEPKKEITVEKLFFNS